MSGLSRLVVRLASWLVPKSLREQWREEWMGELGSTPQRGWWRLSGVPRDALAYRRFHAYRVSRSSPAGQAWKADLKQTCRQLWWSPGYVAVVVVGLSLGIITTLAMVSLVSTIRWGDPAGVDGRASLRRLVAREKSEDSAPAIITAFSPTLVKRLEAGLPNAFSSLAAEELRPVTIRTDSRFSSTVGAYVSGDYFATLGTRPAQGRLLSRSDDRHDGTAAVISHAFWRETFGARADVLGQRIRVGARAFEVVGVAPAGFTGQFDPPAPGHDISPHIWLPISTRAGDRSQWDTPSFAVTLRLSWGGSGSLQAGLDSLGALLAATDVGQRQLTPVIQPVGSAMSRADRWEFAGMSAVLLAGPLAIFAIACANVANMRLARGSARLRELSVRAALGADTRQLVGLLTMESSFLTALVLAVSWIGTGLALTALSSAIGFDVRLDVRAAAAAAVLATASLVTAGLLPAWLIVRRSGPLGIRHATLDAGVGHPRLRGALVVVQVSATLALMTITGLAAQSLRTVAAAQAPVLGELVLSDFNFAAEGLTPAEASAFTTSVLARVSMEPSIQVVGLSNSSLFSSSTIRFQAADGSSSPRRTASLTQVSEEWFRAMDIQLRAGRFLRPGDGRDAVVIDEGVAAIIAPGETAVGRTLELQATGGRTAATSERVQVVGVVTAPPTDPTFQRSGGAILQRLDPGTGNFVSLYVRSRDPEHAARRIRDIVGTEGTRPPWTVVQRATERVKVTTAPLRAVAMASGTLAAIAAILSAIGLAGLTAYLVSLRQREIGVRMALGGRPGDVVAMILRQSARLTGLEICAGLLLAVPAGLLLRDGWIGVSPLDFGSLAPPVVSLVVVCLVAAAVPALRAARVDPIEVLRQE